jgi:hypothetical protein
MHTLGHFSTLDPSFSYAPPPSVPGKSCSTLITNFVEKLHKHNKEDKAFLLLELRIPIQRESYYWFHVPMCYNPCWFNSNSMTFTLVPDPLLIITSVILRFLYYFLWSGDIKCFHVLGFLPILISPMWALPLSCDPSPITLLHLP